MPELSSKKSRKHRSTERYYCPPFFSAYMSGGGGVEEQATVEDLSLRGIKARTSFDFEEGCDVKIRLVSNYAPPLKIHGRVMWTIPPEDDGSSHLVGISITKVRIVDWFKFMKIVSQIKKEVW